VLIVEYKNCKIPDLLQALAEEDIEVFQKTTRVFVEADG
jgi:hypothetical protein